MDKIKKAPNLVGMVLCDPGKIRTCNRHIRSVILYPVELRGHCALIRLQIYKRFLFCSFFSSLIHLQIEVFYNIQNSNELFARFVYFFLMDFFKIFTFASSLLNSLSIFFLWVNNTKTVTIIEKIINTSFFSLK